MSWMPAKDPILSDKQSCDALDLIIVPRVRDLGGGFSVRRALASYLEILVSAPDHRPKLLGGLERRRRTGDHRLAKTIGAQRPWRPAVSVRR